MKKIMVLLFIFLVFTFSTLMADSDLNLQTTKKHQAGLRLGTWINNGATHPSTPVVFSSTDSLLISTKDVNFYLEGFYAYGIRPSLFTEISFGMVNRGEIQAYSSGFYDLSNVLIYPILLQLKFYPFQTTSSKFQPFVGAGGGVYIGKQNIQFTNDTFANFYQLQGDSETDFNYTISGGFDWEVRSNFSLELQGKYMPIHFSDYFIGEKDYSATTITIGFKYKYNNVKK